MCLLGRIGGGATSSRHVMAVLSSQGRGEAETLPPGVNRGTTMVENIITTTDKQKSKLGCEHMNNPNCGRKIVRKIRATPFFSISYN